jgi:membrane-associated phospholipid phosphatase
VQDVLGQEELFVIDGSVIGYLQAHSIGWLVSVARAVNWVSGPVVVAVVALVAGIGAVARQRAQITFAIGVALLGQLAIVELADTLIHRQPPGVTPLALRSDYGFPSEHVAAFVALAVVLAWPWGRPAWSRTVAGYGLVVALATVVAAARLVLLVEFPSDVIAAAAVALGWGLLSCAAFDQLLGRRRENAPM